MNNLEKIKFDKGIKAEEAKRGKPIASLVVDGKVLSPLLRDLNAGYDMELVEFAGRKAKKIIAEGLRR